MPLRQADGPLLQREWRILVSTQSGVGTTEGDVPALDVSELDCEFTIHKTLEAEPNTCSLTIYNLTSSQAAAIEKLNIYEPKKVKGAKRTGPRNRDAERIKVNGAGQTRAPKPGRIRVEIRAGYKTIGSTLLFRGDLRRAETSMDEERSRRTVIVGEDGGRTTLTSRVTESFPPGTTKRVVVEHLLDALGLGMGNYIEVRDQLNSIYPAGTIIDGNAMIELRGVLRAARLKTAILDNSIHFMPTNSAPRSLTQAVLLSEETGLVGSPSVNINGRVQARSLINPAIALGGYVTLETHDSRNASRSGYLGGTYWVQELDYRGATRGDEWYADMVLIPVEQ